MKSSLTTAVVLFLAVAVTACSSSTPQVSFSEPRRVLGRDNDVRIDAQLYAETLSPGSVVQIAYETASSFRASHVGAPPLTTCHPEERRSATKDLRMRCSRHEHRILRSFAPYGRSTLKMTVAVS